MAVSQFSATLTRTPFSQRDSRSKFVDFGLRSNKPRLFFVEVLNRRSRRNAFSVKSVSSEQARKLNDPITDEGPDRLPHISFLCLST